jgi:hypothetical protein
MNVAKTPIIAIASRISIRVIPDILWWDSSRRLVLLLVAVFRGAGFFIADLLDSEVSTLIRRSKSRTRFRETPKRGLRGGCQRHPNEP